MMKYKPMLAASVPMDKIKYPKLAQPKLDGVRMLVNYAYGCYLRSGNQVKKQFAVDLRLWMVSTGIRHTLDGELTYGGVHMHNCCSVTTGMLSKLEEPDLRMLEYHVFDIANPNIPQQERLNILNRLEELLSEAPITIKVVPTVHVHNEQDLRRVYEDMLNVGYEGVILRNPKAMYKSARATGAAQQVVKLKPEHDLEIELTGVEEAVESAEIDFDAWGNAKAMRRIDSEGKGMAGAIYGTLLQPVKLISGVTLAAGIEIKAGVGKMTHKEREDLWNNTQDYLGKVATIRYTASGAQDTLRFPRFVSWRIDL